MTARVAFCSPPLFLIAALAGAPTLPALSAGEITHTGGVLGTSVTYDLKGNPGVLYVFAPSLNNGPTPLALFDPSDLRVLEVGLDLVSIWSLGAFDFFGNSQIVLPLPPAPALEGLPLRAQMVEIVLIPTVFGDLSPLNSFTLGFPQQSVFTANKNVASIYGHTTHTLDDGRVLLVGGYDDPAPGTTHERDSFVVFDPQDESFTELPDLMSTTRAAHASAKLADGRVLVIGGANAAGGAQNTADIWDPATEKPTPTPLMNEARIFPTATLLNDGRVFVAGGIGSFDFSDVVGALSSARRSTEIYDPVTDTWTPGPDLPKGRVGHRASLLGDGRVLITGGLEVTVVFGVPVPNISSDCRRYDPGTDTILSTASFTGQRALHGQVTLNNGDALIAGGGDGSLLTLVAAGLDTTRVYDHQADVWTNTAPLNTARGYLNLVNTGTEIVAIGGLTSVDLTTFTGPTSTAIETTTQSVLSWTPQGDMKVGRELGLSNLCDGGLRILTTGSGHEDFNPFNDTGEIYIP